MDRRYAKRTARQVVTDRNFHSKPPLVRFGDQDWVIFSMDVEWSSDTLDFNRNNIELELRAQGGAEMTLNIPESFELEVLQPKPWEGLKPGDLLSGRDWLFVFLGFAPNEPDEPYLMHITRWDHRPNSDQYITGYSRWSWYNEQYGPLQKLTFNHNGRQQDGLNYYRKHLGLKELTDE